MTDSEGAKELLGGYFKGDREAMKKSIAYGRRNRIKWSDIALNARLYPEFKTTAQDLIKTVLGFNPPDRYILPHESFIRVAINQFMKDELTKDQLFSEAETHLKLVRNELVRDHLEIYCNRNDYKRYYHNLLEVAEKAKDRLTNFLGYMPSLETSVSAEVFLREALVDPTYTFDDRLNTTDLEALILIKFREVLLTKGLDAALASPLPAQDLISAHILKRTANEKNC